LDSIGSDVKSLLVQLDEPDFPYWEFYRFRRWDTGRARWLLLIRTDEYLATTREGWEDRGLDFEAEATRRLFERPGGDVVELTSEMRVFDSGAYHVRRSWTPDPDDEDSVSASVETVRVSGSHRRSSKLPLLKSTQQFVTTRNA